jgi:C4-dicarboxylate transporter, DctM subunit
MTSSSRLASWPERPAGVRVGRMLGSLLDHLEEWLIATLVAVATAIVFVAVLHRYGTSTAIDSAKWLEAHGLDFAAVPLRAAFAWMAARDLSWAQELCIYLFIWMAKFGAAYGVRTGIHVGVDVLVNRMDPARARKVILFGLLAGALFTATIARFGWHFTVGVWHSGTRSNDLEAPMWIVYLAIPLGSALMCFRFLQAGWKFWKTGILPRHDAAHVDGVEAADIPPPMLQADAPARGAPGGGVALSWIVLLLPFLLLGVGLLAKYGVVHAGGGLRATVVFGLLVSLMLTGMPISIALGLTVLSFMVILGDISLDSVAMKLFTGIESFEIMAIPFFILAGNFLTHGGVARRMIAFATSLVGQPRWWATGMAASGCRQWSPAACSPPCPAPPPRRWWRSARC